MNTVKLTSNDAELLFYKFKRRLFESSFMHKYGTFFDILCYAQFPYSTGLSIPYQNFINALAGSWNEFGGCDAVYNETPCIILYAYYNRFRLLEKHLTAVQTPVAIPDVPTADKFRYIFIDFLTTSGLE